MDEEQLQRIARDIEELKTTVKRNDPLLREVLTRKGWALLGFGGGIGLGLFALPAHFLSIEYGSFGAIPALWRGFIWAALVLAVAGGGIWKMALISKRVGEVDPASGLGELWASFFGAASIHVTAGMLVAIGVAVAFAVWVGHPWFALPASAIVMGVWMNAIGSSARIGEYFVAGWWSIGAGAACLFSVERAPFLWVFAVYGGMFLAFGVAALVASRKRKPRDGAGPA